MNEKDNHIDGSQYYCRVNINNIELSSKLIQSLSMREFIFDTAVELDLEFIDNGAFVEISPIVDGSVLSVLLAKDKEEDPINIEFDILNSKILKKNSTGNSVYFVSLVAIQKTSHLFQEVSQKVHSGPSSKVIGEIIGRNSNLTYKSDINSNDSQLWYQISINDSSFIKNIMSRAYYKDKDIPVAYCNIKGEFNYTTLRTRCSQKAKYVALNNDLLALDSGSQNKALADLIPEDMKDKILYFKSNYSFNDNMPIENRTGGYGFDFTYFDAEDFHNKVITFNYAPFTNMINKKPTNEQMYASFTYNMQHSNVHDNYLLAINQNSYLKKMMFSYYTTITVSPNLKIDLMDKINVSFIKQFDIETGKSGIDDVHSGEYLVGGIYHNIHVGGLYTMVLILFRNGFNLIEDSRIQNVNLVKVEK